MPAICGYIVFQNKTYLSVARQIRPFVVDLSMVAGFPGYDWNLAIIVQSKKIDSQCTEAARDKEQEVRMIHNRSKWVIAFILSTGILGTAALLITIKTALRTSNPAPIPHDVWVGDVLPALPNYSWGEHDHSVVLAVREECPHCRASVPVYRQLQSMVAARANRVGIIAIFPNPPNKVRSFLEHFNLDIPALPDTPLEQIAVSGTPTVILADSRGTVMRVWVGELDVNEQRELFAQLRSYLGEKER